MPLISKQYREMNRELHARDSSYGISACHFRDFVFGLHKLEGYETILDYGCGKGVLKQLLPNLPIVEYDPAIEGKDALPQPAELVCCFDVLEHIEPEHLNSVLRHLQAMTKQKLVFNISTRPARKVLADGRNAHICLHDEKWWRKKMLEHFQILAWDAHPDMVYGEALPIRGPVLREHSLATRKRRPIPREMHLMFDHARAHSAKYADEIHRIKTISMWEGNGDQHADMQIMLHILEHCADMDEALANACKLARLSVSVIMRAPRNEALWRNFFERKLRIVDWEITDVQGAKMLFMAGAPMVGVQGIRGVGAVDEDKRYDQVKWATPRYAKRIPVAPPSTEDRTAILCCYGPSLKDQLSNIKAELAKGRADIISVSGAHDFLIENGIVPKYHIECDPRPHKTNNIDLVHPDVQYLIASTCHRSYFEKLDSKGADVALWHVATPGHATKLVDELGESSDHIISGGGSVGLRSLPLLYCLGYRDYAVFGMDSSFRVSDEDMQRLIDLLSSDVPDKQAKEEALLKEMAEGSTQWAGKHAGKRQLLCSVSCGNRLFVSSPILLTYATNFFETIQKGRDCKYRIYGDSLLSAMSQMYCSMPQYQELAAQAA